MGLRDQWLKKVRRALDRESDVLRHAQALGLHGAARAACLRLGEPPMRSLGQLMPWQEATLEAAMERLCCPDAEDLPMPSQIDATARTLAWLRQTPPETQQRMGYLLALLEAGPSVMGPARHKKRFTALEPQEQDRYLEMWQRSSLPPQRAGLEALKAACCLGYWSHPRTWGPLGYSVARNPGVPPELRQRFEGEEA